MSDGPPAKRRKIVAVSNVDRRDAAELVQRLHHIQRMYHPNTPQLGDVQALLFDQETWPKGTAWKLFWECLVYSASLRKEDVRLVTIICRRMFEMDTPVFDYHGRTMLQHMMFSSRNRVADAILALADEFPEHVDFDRVDPDGYSLLWRSVDAGQLEWVRMCAARCSRATLCSPVISENNQSKGRPLEHVFAAAWRTGGYRCERYIAVADELLAYAHDDGSGLDLLQFDYVKSADGLVRREGFEEFKALRDKIAHATERQRFYRVYLRTTIREALDARVGHFSLQLSIETEQYLL